MYRISLLPLSPGSLRGGFCRIVAHDKMAIVDLLFTDLRALCLISQLILGLQMEHHISQLLLQFSNLLEQKAQLKWTNLSHTRENERRDIRESIEKEKKRGEK
jgi:hypothetical protein